MKLEEQNQALNEGVHDHGIFKAVFLGGGPGSGKDHVMKQTLMGHGLTEINSDNALEYLMDRDNLDKKMPDSEEAQRNVLRKKAKSTTELRQRLAIHGRNGLIINGTADDPEKIANIKKRLEKLGYETKMLMVNSRDEVSQQRNIERGQRGGRTVDEVKIRKPKWDAVQAARPHHAKLFGKDYHEYDNSDDLRTAPPETVKAKTKELNDLYSTMRQFTTTPSQHPRAQNWIAKQLQKRDREPINKEGSDKLPPHGSQAAEHANELGLQYYGTGRYGKDGRVTHRVVNDNLVDVQKTQREADKKKNTQKIKQKKTKKNVNESFQEFINESVSISISADTPEELKSTFKLLIGDDGVNSEQYTFSNDASLKLLSLGKPITEGNDNVQILKESIFTETESPTTSNGRTKDRQPFGFKRLRESYTPDSGRACRDETISENTSSCGKETKTKITLQQIRDRKKAQLQKESIDKGIEPGLSMAASGESIARDMGEKTKKKTGKSNQVFETVGSGGEMATSISDQKEDELKKKGISLTTFRSRRPIG